MIVGKLIESCAIGLKRMMAASAERPLRAFSQYTAPPGIRWDDEKYQGDAYGAYGWAVYVAEVTVDMLTWETRVDDFVAVQEDINTRKGVERIIRYAFEYSERHPKLDGSPRQRVLMCDKSNAMTHAGGLWQRVFKEVSGEYPQIKTEHMYVDALCMQMVRDPRQFDIVVTNNMFGDIITDLAAGLQGGLGMAASGNIHPGKTSMFEPVHGSAPTIARKNVANPFGAILTAAMMLAHLGLTNEATKIEAAVLEAVQQNRTTQDVGGALGTREAGEWVAKKLSHG